jgi:DNA-directed RNA polymerase specialized sigma24 family protein
MSPSPDLLPDALLVQRMAALSDRAALLELDARHGMTLYALAYGLLFDGEAADVTVAAALREAWRSAASFDANGGTVAEWLAYLTRRAAQQRLEVAVA